MTTLQAAPSVTQMIVTVATARGQRRTFTTSKGERVDSILSDGEAASIVLEHADKLSGFARQLAQSYAKYGLTPAQLPYLHKFAMEILNPAPAITAPAVGKLDLLPLFRMMQHAASKLKNPRVVVTFPAVNGVPETTLQLSVCGERSKTPGCVNVTDGRPYGDNVWFGRINLDGTFQPSPRVTGSRADGARTALEIWAADPAGVARAHGRRTANCCFCRRHLETAESLSVGYGPVCADKFGLPWGVVEEVTT